MNSTGKFVLTIVFSFMVALDIFFYMKGREKKCARTGLKVFLFENLFCIGNFLSVHIRLFSSGRRKRRNMLLEMYEPEEAEKILKSAENAPLTYLSLFVPGTLAVFILSGNGKVIFILLFLTLFLCFYFDIWLTEKIKERHNEILHDFASVLSKISLLINAGITANEAFNRVAYSGNGILYKEMKRTVSDISNGMSYDDALNKLALHTGCKEVKKFISLYKQNLVKGGGEFPILLCEMSENAWMERKLRAESAGGTASQKLLMPILLMFSGVLLIVIVPAFNSLLK